MTNANRAIIQTGLLKSYHTVVQYPRGIGKDSKFEFRNLMLAIPRGFIPWRSKTLKQRFE